MHYAQSRLLDGTPKSFFIFLPVYTPLMAQKDSNIIDPNRVPGDYPLRSLYLYTFPFAEMLALPLLFPFLLVEFVLTLVLLDPAEVDEVDTETLAPFTFTLTHFCPGWSGGC